VGEVRKAGRGRGRRWFGLFIPASPMLDILDFVSRWGDERECAIERRREKKGRA